MVNKLQEINWAGNFFVLSDLSLDPSVKVKQG